MQETFSPSTLSEPTSAQLFGYLSHYDSVCVSCLCVSRLYVCVISVGVLSKKPVWLKTWSFRTAHFFCNV
jgi:hypothetical protein